MEEGLQTFENFFAERCEIIELATCVADLI
jgi:hypothetical protein